MYKVQQTPFDLFFDNIQVVHTRGAILEENHYYPFGMVMAGLSSKAAGGINNKYKYNGKELQNGEFSDGSGLEWTDYGARMYDGQIGRWGGIDELSHKYLDVSPYSSVLNNPIRYYDEDGRLIRDKDGNIVFVPIGNPTLKTAYNGTITLGQSGFIFADDGTKIEVFKNVGSKDVPEFDSDCHGWTFTGGKFWIDNGQVAKIITGDNYKVVTIDDIQKGDVVIYSGIYQTDAGEKREIEDSRTVSSTNNSVLEDILVYGKGGVEKGKPYDKKIKEAWESEAGITSIKIFRKTDPDNKLESDKEKDDLRLKTTSEFQSLMRQIAYLTLTIK